ncbi:hypothetical protein [Marinithermus hydrothermalis]|uniref:Uncharacterized protein n=1 Tax=Marinithermus hydrothermalis (strain DSM 14884 / JCM 11576 / T1) TaxID=869210 RepID=F2NMH8_MARHT|nr:hypothetical protein [Marinithermus hydrothermalis]AEB12148.1 hypothetical protein Marky_1413 [Marinithermus hydrothermalis DSM 14884]
MPEDLKPDWKDFLALVIAAYQLLLVPVLLIIGGIVLAFLLINGFFG